MQSQLGDLLYFQETGFGMKIVNICDLATPSLFPKGPAAPLNYPPHDNYKSSKSSHDPNTLATIYSFRDESQPQVESISLSPDFRTLNS